MCSHCKDVIRWFSLNQCSGAEQSRGRVEEERGVGRH